MQTFRTYADSTLMRMTKKELIEHLRIAEHNRATAEAFNEQQYQNMKDWAPVVHAYWIPGAGDFTNGNSTHECSHCGDFIDYYKGGADEYNFCPYCGAMMDGKPPVDSNKR